MSYLIKTKSEYRAHELIKRFVNQQVVANDFQHRIYKSSLEKSIGERRADVYFYYKTGKKVVVEIQNSPMSSKEITARINDYNKKGIYVLWILNGQGKCVGEPKIPLHQKDLKVSPAEMRLHQLYRGRVYYVNIDKKNDRLSITKPFALHFTESEHYSNKIFRKDHKSFFIRNVYSTFIPSWNILLKLYGRYRIARFYDKNFVFTVADRILFLIHKLPEFKNISNLNKKMTKKLYNVIYNKLQEQFGEFLIVEAFKYLTSQDRLTISSKYLVKHQKKLKKKSK